MFAQLALGVPNLQEYRSPKVNKQKQCTVCFFLSALQPSACADLSREICIYLNMGEATPI